MTTMDHFDGQLSQGKFCVHPPIAPPWTWTQILLTAATPAETVDYFTVGIVQMYVIRDGYLHLKFKIEAVI